MAKFWEIKSLQQLSDQEWESLCDGCARCCLLKLEDEETEELFFTNISCCQLDIATCQCKDYVNRKRLVPECLEVRKMSSAEYSWLPETCAYRLIAEGKPLYEWHPLISGRAESVYEAGISVRQFAVSEEHVHPDQWQEHVIQLPLPLNTK